MKTLALVCLMSVMCLQGFSQGKSLFESLAPAKTGIHFRNILDESPKANVLTYEYFYNGGGVAVGDIIGDVPPLVALIGIAIGPFTLLALLLTMIVITVFGGAFGIILSRSGAADYNYIQRMFLLESFQLYGIIGTAVALTAPLVWLLKRRGRGSVDPS